MLDHEETARKSDIPQIIEESFGPDEGDPELMAGALRHWGVVRIGETRDNVDPYTTGDLQHELLVYSTGYRQAMVDLGALEADDCNTFVIPR